MPASRPCTRDAPAGRAVTAIVIGRRAPLLLTALLTLTAATPSPLLDAVPRRAHKAGGAPPAPVEQRTPGTPLQHLQHRAEQQLRSSFHGAAMSCAGGGRSVLYLRSPTPSRSGCRVRFEARCADTPARSRVRFRHDNYKGAGCDDGDSIRIGPMQCAADQVVIRMTDADCG